MTLSLPYCSKCKLYHEYDTPCKPEPPSDIPSRLALPPQHKCAWCGESLNWRWADDIGPNTIRCACGATTGGGVEEQARLEHIDEAERVPCPGGCGKMLMKHRASNLPCMDCAKRILATTCRCGKSFHTGMGLLSHVSGEAYEAIRHGETVMRAVEEAIVNHGVQMEGAYVTPKRPLFCGDCGAQMLHDTQIARFEVKCEKCGAEWVSGTERKGGPLTYSIIDETRAIVGNKVAALRAIIEACRDPKCMAARKPLSEGGALSYTDCCERCRLAYPEIL